MTPASVYVDDSRLVIVYGEPDDERTAVMELETEQERELVRKLLGDVNFWSNFLSSLSAALTQLGDSIDSN